MIENLVVETECGLRRSQNSYIAIVVQHFKTLFIHIGYPRNDDV